MLGKTVRTVILELALTAHRVAPSFRILITGGTSGLVETITDAISIHSIKKAEYARRLAEGRLGHVTLMDHFKIVSCLPIAANAEPQIFQTYGEPSSAKFARAQRNFANSLAGLLLMRSLSTGHLLLVRLFRRDLPPPNQGSTQRQYPAGSRRAYDTHRLWVYAIKLPR
jgi:hypothetical protein